MRTCRLCGTIGDWDWDVDPPHIWFYPCVIGELCAACNERYDNFYRQRTGAQFRFEILPVRNERLLVDFLAHKLEVLAKRYRAGKPITRCEACNKAGERCTFFWSRKIDEHKLCSSHVQVYKQGRKTLRYITDDQTWLDEVVKFFNRR